MTTPLQMAMVLSQVANGGISYRPYLVNKIVDSNGSLVQDFKPEKLGELPISKKTMDIIRESLRNVALEGGTAGLLLKDFPVNIAGKTGTSENPHGSDHGWFVAYAPYEKPEVVVVVIVEQGGFGASSAVPIGKKILEAVFNINTNPPATTKPVNNIVKTN